MEPVSYVRNPIDHDGIETRIAQDHLFCTVGGWVAHVVTVRILDQCVVNWWNFVEELLYECLAIGLRTGTQRSYDGKKVMLQPLPTRCDLHLRNGQIVTLREKQVGQILHKPAYSRLRRNRMAGVSSLFEQVCGKTFDLIGHLL